ncbi:MAG: Sir2 family NAD-dependent protein deacetylase [Bacteroidota bacterium]|nr:Sir2 family NAD-dependent protein deacetylase [Bacteroidota bacterium]
MKTIVVFTGAGISVESGLGTFRDSDGLWEQYKIEDVATTEAFEKNPELVLDFYNIRRKQLLESQPNQAHCSLNKLSEKYNLQIITQNIDDLHERSGSKNVLHLHGKLVEAKSTFNDKIYPITSANLYIGDLCEKGSQLRPNVVWFGEAVPKMTDAINITQKADIFIVIGTSLNVYPAASLLQYTENAERIVLIDPNAEEINGVEIIKEKATFAVPKLVAALLQ